MQNLRLKLWFCITDAHWGTSWRHCHVSHMRCMHFMSVPLPCTCAAMHVEDPVCPVLFVSRRFVHLKQEGCFWGRLSEMLSEENECKCWYVAVSMLTSCRECDACGLNELCDSLFTLTVIHSNVIHLKWQLRMWNCRWAETKAAWHCKKKTVIVMYKNIGFFVFQECSGIVFCNICENTGIFFCCSAIFAICKNTGFLCLV